MAKDSVFAQIGAGMIFDLWDVFCDHAHLTTTVAFNLITAEDLAFYKTNVLIKCGGSDPE